MPIREIVLWGVLTPALVAGVSFAAGWRPWRADRGAGEPDGRWSGAPAVGLAFFAGYALSPGIAARPFTERAFAGQDWIAWIGLAGALLLACTVRSRLLGGAVRAALAAALCFGVLTAMRRRWEGDAELRWLAGLGALLALGWGSTELLARRARGAALPIVLIAAGSCFAVACGLTGSVVLAQLAGSVCAALGAGLVIAWWRPRFTLQGGALDLALLALFGIGLCAHFYSALSGTDALLLWLAPFGAWVRELPGVRGRPAWQRALLGALGALVPAGIALGRIALAYEADPYGY